MALHLNVRKSVISGSIASVGLGIPDPAGLNDQPGLSNLVVDSIRGCVYVAAAGVVSVYLKWTDPALASNPQSLLLTSVTVTGAGQVPFSFAPFMDENGLALPGPVNGASVFVNWTGGAATQTVTNASHIFVNYHYE